MQVGMGRARAARATTARHANRSMAGLLLSLYPFAAEAWGCLCA
jgi:hypothetical protein